MAVGDGLPVGNLEQEAPHLLPERGADGCQGGNKGGLTPTEIGVEPKGCSTQDSSCAVAIGRRQGLNNGGGEPCGQVALPAEPKANQSPAVGSKKDFAERGLIRAEARQIGSYGRRVNHSN